ncbi:CCA tRNA nucleotidyltransferase [bacterium]|nr:CCA tRNA nucleotidyltransferase [bacterium]
MGIISLYEKSENLYFVGGIVRDELLGKKSPDIDLTYVGNAVDFAKSLDFEITQINEEFGSVHLKICGKTIDITSTRTEIYPKKGRLPLVQKTGCSLWEDVKRRDFTINAIAKNCKTGEIVDYVGGIDDLKHKKLRILHENSFIDDPTRIIRGLKFAVRFGFDLEENTKRLQDQYLTNVNYDMSFKRLKDELKDAFNLNKQEVLDKFIEQKMYKLLSENSNFNNYKCNVEDFIKTYRKEIKYIWLIYLAGFDLGNLPLSKKEAKIIENFSEMKNLGGFELYKKFKKSEIEAVVMYGLIYDFDFTKNYLDNLREIELNISGKDLIELGYEPSKRVSEVLDEILKQKLKKPNMTKEDEIELAKNYM